MSPKWIYRNTVEAWKYRASTRDFLGRLRWIYASRLPGWLRRDEQEISFRFCPPIGRIKVLVRSNAGSDAFIFGEVFHHRYYDLPMSAPPTTILDLGANAGFTAVYFGRCYPAAEIACVEPMADNLRLLQANCDLNGINASIISAAIAADDGDVLMELDRMDYGHRVVETGIRSDKSTQRVDAISMPTLLGRLRWERVGLMKVDIEGYEKVLFAGDCPWLERVDAMCIECHEGFGEQDLCRISGRYGFLEPIRLPGVWWLGRR